MNLRCIFLAVACAMLLSGCGPTILEPKGHLRNVTVLGQEAEAKKDMLRILEVIDEIRPQKDAFFYTIKVKYSLKNRDEAIVDFTSNIANLDVYGVEARQKISRGSGELEVQLGVTLNNPAPSVKSYQIGVFLRTGPEGSTLAEDYRSIPFEQTRKK
jgi:hypothetical protein